MKKFIFLLLLPVCFNAFSQLQMTNVPRNLFSEQKTTKKNARISEEQDTLTLKLPFWEDFSTSKSTPDTMKWLKKSGVFVNNSLAINPPSKNVATFDGIDTVGRPYVNVPPTLTGIRDVLTSHFFDISQMKTDSALRISFFWQMQGRGERPDREDYLRLECRDSLGNWQRVWQQNGNAQVKTDTFFHEIIHLQNPSFFHKKFQFRFVNFGRLSGAFDTWHLDYIYLNSQRKPDDLFRLDMACSEYPEFITNLYSSMPYKHFLSDTTFFKRDTVRANMNNLFNVFNTLSYKTELFDSDTKERYGIIMDTSGIIRAYEWRYSLPAAPFFKNFPKDREKLRVTCRYSVNTNERDNFLPPLNFRVNDTIERQTVFEDYYAYDDGSAEYGLGLAQRFGKLAYKYHVAGEGRITHIDVYFLPAGKNLVGQTFNLMVWKKIDFSRSNPKDEVLLVQNEPFVYSGGTDSFRRIKLIQPIAVSDSFYIGWQQLGEQMLPCGYDRNTDSGDLIFYNTSNRWEQNKIYKGSLMLRPVFGARDPLSSGEQNEKFDVNVYPNPAQDRIFVEGYFDEIRIFDLLGREILRKESEGDGREEIITKDFQNGVYILKIIGKRGEIGKKIMVGK
jgi:hypothetical protein